MQFDAQLIDHLRQAHSQQWLRRWTGRIDAHLAGQGAGDAQARLAAAAALVLQDLALPQPLAGWVGAELAQTREWLSLALQAGAAWRDARGAALLQAGVGLGALWFIDPRLLPPERTLPVRDSLAGTVAELMCQPMATPYGMAVRMDEAIRVRCGPTLQAAMKAARERGPGALAAPLRNLQRLVFARASDDGQDEAEETPTEASEAAQAFMRREQLLLEQVGVKDAALAQACVAGDLVLGLGRCVRLVAGPLAPAATGRKADALWEVIDGLAQDSQ